MTIKCGTREHASIVQYAALMCVVFPLGVPFAMGMLLYLRRGEIEDRKTREGDPSLDSLRVLFSQFSPTKWWMAPVDIYRRIMLSSLLLFFKPASQLLLGILTTVTFTVCLREMTPWYDASMDLVAYAAGWQTVLCVVTLLFMIDVEDFVGGEDHVVPGDLVRWEYHQQVIYKSFYFYDSLLFSLKYSFH